MGLEQPDIRKWVSGKFVLHVVENSQRDKELHVVVEIAPGIEPAANLTKVIGASIRAPKQIQKAFPCVEQMIAR